MMGTLQDRGRSTLWLTLLCGGAMTGAAIAHLGWLALLIFLLLCALLAWPVQLALGGFAFLVPFDEISALNGTGHGLALTYVAAAGATVVLLGTGMMLQRIELPGRPALRWALFIGWALLSLLWAYDSQATRERIPTMISLFVFYIIATSFKITERELSAVTTFAILGCAI